MMPRDARVACQATPERVHVFDRVIHLTVLRTKDEPLSSLADVYIEEAKSICGGCLSRTTCLERLGQDYSLGVVGGLTDRERRKLYEKATA